MVSINKLIYVSDFNTVGKSNEYPTGFFPFTALSHPLSVFGVSGC